ncbi:hypothetical protein Dimus_019858, partial [Dionaea muscipula]
RRLSSVPLFWWQRRTPPGRLSILGRRHPSSTAEDRHDVFSTSPVGESRSLASRSHHQNSVSLVFLISKILVNLWQKSNLYVGIGVIRCGGSSLASPEVVWQAAVPLVSDGGDEDGGWRWANRRWQSMDVSVAVAGWFLLGPVGAMGDGRRCILELFIVKL